jgi:hypothetical protein
MALGAVHEDQPQIALFMNPWRGCGSVFPDLDKTFRLK